MADLRKFATIGDLRRALKGAQGRMLRNSVAMDAALTTARACGASPTMLAKVGSPSGALRVALRALGHPNADGVHREALPHVLAQWRRLPAMDRMPPGGNREFLERFPDAAKIHISGNPSRF